MWASFCKSPAYIPALALSRRSLILSLLALKLLISGILGAYPYNGVNGDVLVALGKSG